jgi:hypothetical protein
MKAIAVYPGKPNSMHLEDISIPKVTDIPNGRGVLVKVLRVGVDGTDKEINAAEYGNAPYSLANMQVWTEPASAPDHEFVCFEPTVSSEDALNRSADRLNIAPCSSRRIVLQLRATPLQEE